MLSAGYAFGGPEALRLIAFSNAQAANLSSEEFPAYTMHRACKLQVQKLSNSMMKPNESQLLYLQGYWGPARVLVLEEFTMCPAEGYNMGLLRSAYGRARQCGRNVDEYLVRGNFWGGIPIVIQLGDPLQKRPVKAASLLDTKEMLLARVAAKQNVSIEAQDAIKVFRQFDIAFELTATKRFKDEWLPKLLLSMRQADSATGRLLDRDLWNRLRGQTIPLHGSTASLLSMRAARLREAKSQCAHTIGQYHQTVVRLFYCRAKRDARRLRVPLCWCQAADDVKGLAQPGPKQPKKQQHQIEREKQVRRALFRSYDCNETAHLMTLLPAHVGTRVRLAEKVLPQHGLVQEAEGTIVDIVPDPQESLSSADTEVLLKYAPRGFWVLFDKCSNAPLANAVKDLLPKAFDEAPWTHTHAGETEKAQPGEPPLPALRQRLVFVGAVQRTFKRELAGTKWTVTRRQVPLASALDRTVQSSQGLTFRKGVLADLGCLAGANRDDHWLSVYVMLSRATSLDDLLLLRLPDLSFFDQGPPPYLREFLEMLHRAGGPLQEAREEGFGLADLLRQ